MANKYTYNDFWNAANTEGLLNTFSEADMKLANSNPDAGMSILNYKKDYINAKTDEQRALANMGAENIRSSYGNYTSGNDGTNYYLDQLSPSSFNYASAPTYENKYSGITNDLLGKMQNYGSYSYAGAVPTYQNRYDDRIQDLLSQITNRDEFSYDHNADDLYKQYKKAYTREGQRATEDTMAAASAASGGIPSSYAATAASQAGDYYASQLTDKIPELYQMAYDKYLDEYSMKNSDLAAYMNAEQSDYSKYLNALSQYNADRSFDYGKWLDEYNLLANNYSAAQNAEQQDYNKYLNELNQYNTDRNFAYGNLLDEISSQTAEREEALNNAMIAAQYGDYSGLNDMGIDTSNNNTDFERRYQLAQLAAKYGDYSGLRSLGIDTTAAEAAALAGSTQDDTLSADTSGIGTDMLAQLAASYPNGIVPAEIWNQLTAVYGADALAAAGYTREGGESESEGYRDISAIIEQMEAYGKPKSDVAEMLREAYETGLITEKESAKIIHNLLQNMHG